ncbi:hypothetical protein FNY88_06370 [Corynebacterium guaraldiae]|uniref:Uncharacterized protein n=1 Tax=Corynebacterium guaraldiae TaxID=3051103 RepID=A0ABY3CTR5_9CORY|nr:hypothetical protein [Corynebacterium guaraldiae]TRX48944.1 hypothetical protein FNY88_06370 [Corynebacterium guaraldiae]TRX53243.1 hypothetical protein FNY91_04540 [Corynebacterium guaraldiae]
MNPTSWGSPFVVLWCPRSACRRQQCSGQVPIRPLPEEISEQAIDHNKSAGVVNSVPFSHATPSAPASWAQALWLPCSAPSPHSCSLSAWSRLTSPLCRRCSAKHYSTMH